MPWNTLVRSSGTLMEIWACSPPMKVSARNSPAIRMPIGLSRPRNATMIAVKPYPGEKPGCRWAARHLDDAGEPGERAGDGERQDHELVGIEAGKPRRARRRAHHLDLEALDG